MGSGSSAQRSKGKPPKQTQPGQGTIPEAQGITVAPAKGGVSQTQGGVSPGQGTVSPATGTVSPAKVSVAPAKGIVAPATGSVTPAKGNHLNAPLVVQDLPPGSSGRASVLCAVPDCNNEVSGTSEYCSLECIDKMNELRARPPPIDPKLDVVFCQDPRAAYGDLVSVIGFYYPDKEEECDKICGAGFLGNFWQTPQPLKLSAQSLRNMSLTEHKFRNAEAAFQALKFWGDAREFENLTGDGAFVLKRHKAGFEDRTYGGKGDNWKGMMAVLEAKFAPKSAMAEALEKTGDAFLLEHNNVKGRDNVWSDNSDGEGANWLGMQLMLIRDRLTGRSQWTEWLTSIADLNTGMAHDHPKADKWQGCVRGARNALVRKIEELRPPATCSRPGCNKPTWNGQQNEYCSKACRPPQCSKAGCDKPTWNGRPGEYCSHVCRQADSYWGGGGLYSSPYSNIGGGAGSYRQQAPSYAGVGSYNAGGSSSYNHAAASANRAGVPSICKSPTCSKATWNGKPNEYCKSCRQSGGVGSSGAGVLAGGMIVGVGSATGTPVSSNGTNQKTVGAAAPPKAKKRSWF
mmetsp:Transcript_3734/g.7402  ORF Transcript_3734/g.7402 Transcript_3734/m.7402 type:complete len:572 (+) Transcript_3734:70-1785(+)